MERFSHDDREDHEIMNAYSLYTALQVRIEYIQHDRKKHEPRLTHHDSRLDELKMIFGIINTIEEAREDHVE